VLAYWLDRVAYELERFRHRDRPPWVRQNVVEVLAAIEAGGYGRTS
jgi:hypothetical protein